MSNADFIVIGAGVAGLSAAARLARHGRVAVVEAEDAIGYHSSGRSATFSHYGIGDETVRGLTAYSRRFFEEPPADFSPVPLSRRAAARMMKISLLALAGSAWRPMPTTPGQ